MVVGGLQASASAARNEMSGKVGDLQDGRQAGRLERTGNHAVDVGELHRSADPLDAHVAAHELAESSAAAVFSFVDLMAIVVPAGARILILPDAGLQSSALNC